MHDACDPFDGYELGDPRVTAHHEPFEDDLNEITPVLISGENLRLDQIISVCRRRARVRLCGDARERVNKHRDIVNRMMSGTEPVYGLNTDLGAFAHQNVPAEKLEEFQISTIEGHAVGYGDRLDTSVVRAMMLTRANSMAKGSAGVRAEVIDAIIELLNREVHPVVKAGGSVGESDLHEMSQIALVLLGLGRAEFQGIEMSGEEALAAAGLERLRLQAKEGLSLISSNGFTVGFGSIVIADAMALLEVFNVSAALSLEAFGANLSILHPIVAKMKPHPGHLKVADSMRKLLAGSYLWKKGSARKLQDALSFRCIPQVHGALCEACDNIRQMLEVEVNAGSDNPVVSIEDEIILSTGNFDVTNLAIAFDNLKVAIVHVTRMANERIHKHLWNCFSALPTGLEKKENPLTRLTPLARACSSMSGEAYSLGYPASLSYNAQLCEGVEDYASMAPLAVTSTARLITVARQVAALELMIASAAVDLRGNPQLGIGTNIVYEIVHAHPALDAHVWNNEIARVIAAISDGNLHHWINDAISSIDESVTELARQQQHDLKRRNHEGKMSEEENVSEHRKSCRESG